ncbi:hypothetical protein D0869_00700 [Hortaea werneckii]|uniref:Amine oxidase domain-containing protein n=1 Tax=Hortaea werneckii TaxID=91943 RepID=A0A3M6XGF6_HORWE|nr:hypothetical protein D0869_00700 [Hortaea werneckii]RMY08267.1 hypothetical protein D0868_04898 [Hortaea werneckii]
MRYFSRLLATSSLLQISWTASIASRSETIKFQDGIVAEAGGLQNVHVTYTSPLDGELSMHYGSCDAISPSDCHHALGTTHVGEHELAKRHAAYPSQRPSRFVWLPPHDAVSGGCLHAFSDGMLMGRSAPVTIAKRQQRRWTAAADIMDAEGPWFDGVRYLQEKEPNEVFVASQKSKTIGIIGGGMSGLMTAHLLDSVGFHDWTIVEASGRIGGRVHTSYLNGTRPDQYQYQEMGPMRFPVSITMNNETIPIQDHRMVFQLADVLNAQNGNESEYMVNFIPWYQNTPNTPANTAKRRPDGTVPGRSEVENNLAYATNANLTYSNATAVAEAEEDAEQWIDLDTEKMRSFASNIFEAHKQAIADGYFDYSEAGYLYYKLGWSKNVTDQADGFTDDSPSWPYESVYFSATEWRTIDQGLSKLPEAFGPQVLNRTVFDTSVEGMVWNETSEKMSVQYRNKNLFDIEPDGEMEFDYVVSAVPFTRTRIWHPMPDYSSLLFRAIQNMGYQSACKVALHFETRFWEHSEYPIYGGCGSSNIPGIGSICYPSYNINATGPGVILASYVSDATVPALSALSEEENVARVLRAMVETHGSVAKEQYTGAHDRICWANMENQAGAWCSPIVGQQDLYLPAYFHTEKHTVFVGEHTSYTHAWIWSALESAVRGTTQLLLDMGMVDEAKEITSFWMARWINV